MIYNFKEMREIYQLMDALDEISTALKKGDVDFALSFFVSAMR